LLRAGADPNAISVFGDTPLHLAITGENPEIVQALLAAGAKMDSRNSKGKTPLDEARERNKVVLQQLLENANGA
jgi:uncharacterized protein